MMHRLRLAVSTGLLIAFGFPLVSIDAQRRGESPPQLVRPSGSLPRLGNLSDILDCAGANEVFWTTAMKADPRNPEAHEAKRKAGWYSAVALWVFQVDSTRVTDAVKVASAPERNATVFALARQCREAPPSWRE